MPRTTNVHNYYKVIKVRDSKNEPYQIIHKVEVNSRGVISEKDMQKAFKKAIQEEKNLHKFVKVVQIRERINPRTLKVRGRHVAGTPNVEHPKHEIYVNDEKKPGRKVKPMPEVDTDQLIKLPPRDPRKLYRITAHDMAEIIGRNADDAGLKGGKLHQFIASVIEDLNLYTR